MLGGGATVLSALLLVQAETLLDVGGQFETMAGQAPTGISSQGLPVEQGQLLLAATPALSLRYLSEVDDLRVTSYTRVLWRPAPLSNQRPLFLETLELNELGTPSPRTRWRLTMRGSYGEEDYTVLSQQFLSQPSIPTALTALMLNANGELDWRAARSTELILRWEAVYRRTIDSTTAQTPNSDGTTTAPGAPSGAQTLVPPGANQTYSYAFPPQLTVAVEPGLRHMISRRSTFEALVGLMDSDIGSMPPIQRLNVLSIEPQLGLWRWLSKNHQLHLSAGVAYAVALVKSPQTQSWPPLLPMAQIELISILRRAHEMQWRSYLGAGSNAFTDPVLGTEVLRGTAQARIDLEVGPNWGVAAQAVFATDITGPLQLPGTAATTGPYRLEPSLPTTTTTTIVLPPDETVVSFDVPLYYRVPYKFMVELGARFTQRAPHLRSPDFAWRSNDREMWVFLSFTTLTAQTPRRVRQARAAQVNPASGDQSVPGHDLPPPLPAPVSSPL